MSGRKAARQPSLTKLKPRSRPWEWHIQETFKGLIALSIEALKALLLINGGAAVAILAYLGSLASPQPERASAQPEISPDVLCWRGSCSCGRVYRRVLHAAAALH